MAAAPGESSRAIFGAFTLARLDARGIVGIDLVLSLLIKTGTPKSYYRPTIASQATPRSASKTGEVSSPAKVSNIPKIPQIT